MMNNRSLLYTLLTVFLIEVLNTNAEQNCTGSPEPKSPKVSGGSKLFMDGETFTINCTITYEPTNANLLSWEYPNNFTNVYNVSNEFEVPDKYLYRNITVYNATKENAGTYVCFAKNSCGVKKDHFKKVHLDKAYINLTIQQNQNVIETKQGSISRTIEVNAYPPVEFEIYKDKANVTTSGKYKLNKTPSGDVTFNINDFVIEDTANYTVVAKNAHTSSDIILSLRKITSPKVNFPKKDSYCMQNTEKTLKCEVTAYPLPEVTWYFSLPGSDTREEIKEGLSEEIKSLYQLVAYLKISHCNASGNITCHAKNKYGNDYSSRRFLLYEIMDGFGIKDRHNTWFWENQSVALKCLASKYDFSNVTWTDIDGTNANQMVEYTSTSSSLVATLKINNIQLNDAGVYKCYGTSINATDKTEEIDITVAKLKPTVIMEPKTDVVKNSDDPAVFTCSAEGVPPPTIIWYKDSNKIMPVQNKSDLSFEEVYSNNSIVNSTLKIERVTKKYNGKYECVSGDNQKTRRAFTLAVNDSSDHATYTKFLIPTAAIAFILLLLSVYLTWKVNKEKQFRKELAAAGLLYFKEGRSKSLNPDLGIDEQAELLPYDEKFEFPPEKLVLGKQLGAGAFGVVYKADARGIINAEESTPVAVKMVKKTADNMYIKALASELKIMVHLGKHINIVNLLGACTKNVGKRELVVIVEYCKFGNIHNYMMRHRDVFINQLTDNKEKNLGKVNRGFSSSTGSAGGASDYFGSTNTQDTDHTFLNTANTNRSGRKASEGYVQPEWRSNYETDYSFDGRNPRPLTSRDLLAWSFQIASGMEYLARRKVLHGDLAARNILLAEDNIVKICDFGLARSIYKNDEYQKQENSPLPVKWLAIECMTDRIFSTQSDVWSFGIVLWELFSLAKTPYPNISPTNLLQFLSEGHRLDKPAYADDRLYGVMKKCWEQKPTARPTFSDLHEILGTFLEDNVRNHYVDLNAAYMDMNERPPGEDYLAMVSAPDYNNLVTPSPHHYANVNCFTYPPNTPKLDDEGYLQMSPATNQIFSPRPQAGTKFEFDPRKFNPRTSEASSCGSELTPMLTLNNLPARSGSESDHEGNVSPYLNVCPRIEEESNEVFETKINNARNIENSVHNPYYIKVEIGDEKKPNDIINNYINVPNGLVNGQ